MKTINTIRFLIFLLLLITTVAPGQNVVLVVIDGARYSETFGAAGLCVPHLWNHVRPIGTVWSNFRNSGLTLTIPGHTSIETGTWQTIANDGSERPTKPTIFEYFRKHTGAPDSLACLVVGKQKLTVLSASSDSSYGEIFAGRTFVETGDTSVFRRVRSVLDTQRPRLLLVNFADVDIVGHAGDWAGYLGAIRIVDSLVNCLWETIQSSPTYTDNTVLFVTNDHGRHDDDHGGFQNHGDDCEGCRHIMLLAAGGRFSRGFLSETPRTQCDLAASIGEIVGFPTPSVEGGSILGDTLSARRLQETGTAPVPSRLRVLPIFPNPFNPSTRIRFGIPRPERVEIRIYDAVGREVMTTLDAEQSSGYHTVVVDGSGLASGSYFYRVQSGRERGSGKMLLVKYQVILTEDKGLPLA
jgi:hypothetical protein